MSERGLASRREADELIEAGLVEVDGKIAVLGEKVSPDAVIVLKSKGQDILKKKVSIALHKPVGYVSNLPEKGYPAAIELITAENMVGKGHFSLSHKKGLAVAGRLDIDSRGLLILTQDGVLAKKLIGEDTTVDKEYHVRVEGDVTHEKLKRLRFGLSLDNKPLKRAKVDLLHPNQIRFILNEGKKRQIRRMCEQVDLKVVGLKRVRIGSILLGDLPEGKWRYI